MRRRRILALFLAAATAAATTASAASNAPSDAEDCWTGYLDYAYVYSSAEPRALRERLDRYAAACGLSLSDHIAESIEKRAARDPHLGSDAQRRRAIAHLLQYLSSDDRGELSAANAAIDRVQDRLERREHAL